SPGLGRAREVLEELLRRRALEAPSRLLQRLDERTGYTGVVARLPRGRRRVRDWEGTLELVRRLEVGAEDPFLVARKLRLLLQGGVQAERPPLEAGNALALLTVHAAKGLEWPVVFVLHVGGWKGNGGLRKDKPLFRPGLALVPPLLDDEGEPSSLFLLAKAALEEEEGAEEERLLYVAATRAGERLYLLLSPEGSSPSPEQGEQDSLWKELREAGAVGVNLEAGPPQPGEATQGEDLPHLLTEGLEGLPLEALPISLLPLAARDPEAARRWLLGEPLEEDLPFPDLAEEVEAEEEAPGGAGVGGMVHALLERLESAEELDREGRGLLERDFPGAREEREEALRLARSFLEGEAFAPFREGSVLKEVPVVLEVGGVRLEGRADRVGEGWVLDYKTDRGVDLEGYALQVGAYALALGKAKAYVANLRRGTVHPFQPERIRSRIEEVVARLVGLPAPGPRLPSP
ncbi:3'-5' exonuclease, partial [Thermus sp.]|uniref:3'-5' exonuclease n=1 Tax=Thermus sp. TaxID=275 RepID=UPI00298F237B